MSVVILFSVASLYAAEANAQAILRVSEDVNFRFGFLLQTQAEFAEQPNAAGTGTDGYAEALFIRRARLRLGGQVAKNVFFFFQTDNSNLGRKTGATTNLGSGFQLINAEVEWRIDKAFNLIGGLFRVPYSRESMKAVASFFEIDAQTYNAVQGPSMGWTGTNRDTGFQIRGYLLSDRLEYRVAATQGARQADSKNSFALTARIQYNFFGTEVYNTPSYPGSYLDGKKMLTVGAAYQEQGTFQYASADVFASIPVGPGIVEGTFEYQYLDGAKMFPLLAHQNITMIEAGYYALGSKLGPWARYEQIVYNGATSRNEQRVWAGIGWFPFRYNFNVKGAWERIMPKTSVDRDQFVLQLQLYYY
ncbi:MAG: porin [Thermoanaerobaculia bacterium]